MRWWPRSLAGQMALLIALALFVAQAINFALLVRERRQFALMQVTGQLAARFADAAERNPDRMMGRMNGRGRVRMTSSNPIRPSAPRVESVEAALRPALIEAGVRAGAIVSTVAPIAADSPVLRRTSPGRARYLREVADELTVAVERPGGGWLVQRAPWVRRDSWLQWRLAGQTLILFGIILLPVLWVARRISRPLRDLTRAAEDFGRGEPRTVPVSGPHDLAMLIAAYNRLAERVTAMLDEKDRMLGAIGHDLRTPLAALRVRIESVEDDGDRIKMADTVDEMNRTLDDILSLARLGRPSEAPHETDLAALVDAVVEDFRDLGQPVEMADTPRLAMRLRSNLMRRAVRNLIENAVKYGGGAEVSVAAHADAAAIVVADRGPGIPPERLGDVFEAFTRLETSRNRDTGGIGLGLALARAIVREAGGDVVLANRDGGGLTATITLPRR